MPSAAATGFIALSADENMIVVGKWGIKHRLS